MLSATGIKVRLATRAAIAGSEILIDRQLMSARATQDRLLTEFRARPNAGFVICDGRMAVYARIPAAAAIESYRDDIKSRVPVRTPRLRTISTPYTSYPCTTRMNKDLPFGNINCMAEFETATLAAGCFWCVEAVFDDLIGVEDVVSGYSGGHKENPTYQEVCSETTGHAEVVQIRFDPDQLTFADLLRVYFTVHDPTTLNRQGNDVGSSYRSAIFYHSPEQKATAEEIVKEISAAAIYDNPIVTEVAAFDKFWPAEDYHQEYFANNPNQPYCAAVVAPKVAKFRQKFAARLKK